MQCHSNLEGGFGFSSPCCFCCTGGNYKGQTGAFDSSGLQWSVSVCECVCVLIVMSFSRLSTSAAVPEGDVLKCLGWHWDKSPQLRLLFPVADIRQLAPQKATRPKPPTKHKRQHLIAFDTCMFPSAFKCFHGPQAGWCEGQLQNTAFLCLI